MNVKRFLADMQIKELSLIGKTSIFPTEELKLVLLLRTVPSPKIACVIWQVLSKSDNLGNLLLWNSLFYKMVFAELLLKSQLKEVTVSSFHCPIKHINERRKTAGRLSWNLLTARLLSLSSLPPKKLFKVWGILNGVSWELGTWSLDLPCKPFHGNFFLPGGDICVMAVAMQASVCYIWSRRTRASAESA